MIRNLLRTVMVGMAALTGLAGMAQTITMTTDAPAGTKLRIYLEPFNSQTVTGADKSDFAFEYISKGPGSVITITGDLEQAEVYSNQLTSLKIDGAEDLFILKCNDNKLTSLDVANCPALVNLYAQNNDLTAINLASNSKLEKVDLSGNKLESVVAGVLPALTFLDLGKNNLSEAELGGCTAVEELRLNNNNFEFVDLSANTKLYDLRIYGNKISGQDMDDFCEAIVKPTGGASFYALYIVNTLDPAEGNLCTAANVAYLHDVKDWGVLDWYDGEIINGIRGKVYYGCDVAPSVNENHQITLKTSRAVGEKMSLIVKSQADLRFEGLKEPVKVGSDKAAEYTLTSQTVTIYGDVDELQCQGNDLTALSFFGTPVLTKLNCSDNKIEHLSLVNCKTITEVSAQKNALKTMTLQGCDALSQVNVYDNALKGFAMTNFMRSLPTSKDGALRIIDTESKTEQNVATTTDVKIATDKGWGVWDYFGGGNYGIGKRYAGSEPTGDEDTRYLAATTASATQVQIELAGENISETQMPVVENATIAQWTGRAIQLNVTPGQEFKIYGDITEIQGAVCDLESVDITRLPNLNYFMMFGSGLSSLDLSQSIGLVTLNVADNALTTLDFSNCPNLKQVLCYGNNISGANMTAMMNSLIERTEADYGSIIVYDGKYDYEHNVCLTTDVAIAMDKWWAVYEVDGNTYKQYFGVSGIEDVDVENVAPVYYNLQGIRVDNPEHGIYIERRGNKTVKVMF